MDEPSMDARARRRADRSPNLTPNSGSGNSDPTPNPSPQAGRDNNDCNLTPNPSPLTERGGNNSDLEARRARERAKYEQLAATTYGGTNHGRFATRLVRSLRPGFVVDFGCGKNRFIHHLRRFGISGIGIDFAMPEADVRAPMHQVPLENAVADVVTAFDSMEHLLPEEVDEVLDEMRRVAKPGAHFVFSIATKQSHLTACGEHLHPTVQPLSWWREQIERVGMVRKRLFLLKYIVGQFKAD